MVVNIKQSNYESQQNLKIDIDKIYSDFIQKIDRIRSYVNCNSVSDDYYKSFSLTEESKTANRIAAQAGIRQESRCHAFYRLLGLPVVGKDDKFYSSGFDIIQYDNVKRDINKQHKINVAKNLITGFKDLSNIREQIPLNNLNYFSNNKNIDAAVRSLTVLSSYEGNNNTIISLRPFSKTLEKVEDPYDMISPILSYKVGYEFMVGGNPIKFTDLRDASNTPPSNKIFKSRHIISPFIVDPRIDFTAEVQICVPFPISTSFTKVSPDTFAEISYIERIINERVTKKDSSDASTYYQKLKDIINAAEFIKDEDLIKKVNQEDASKGVEQEKLLEFLRITSAMVVALKNSISAINKAQNEYYWLPIPSVAGPEYSSAVRDPISFKDMPKSLLTTLDKEIIIISAQLEQNRRSVPAAAADGLVKATPLNVLGSISDPTKSRGIIDIIEKNLKKLIKTRQTIIGDANNALRTIEIIMGEFSGLGLADIIAIIYALYLMPIEDVFGLLDEDAFNRGIKAGVIDIIANKSDIATSMGSLLRTVNGLYEIMDKFYQDASRENSSFGI